MKLTDEETEVLRRVVRAVEGVVPEFVIAGGQAARLLRLHPLAVPLAWAPIFTSDLDVATADKGHRGKSLAKALESEGFEAAMAGDDVPPRTLYVLGTAEVEIIVPDLPRRASSGSTVKILGASAQKVKDLEPLLVGPEILDVPGVGPVRVPHPAAYILQKVLTLTNRRTLERKGKDALYVHDALLLFTHGGRLHPDVIAAAKRVLGTVSTRQAKKIRENAERLGDSRTDFVLESARQAAGRAGIQSSEALALANRLGLKELLEGTES